MASPMTVIDTARNCTASGALRHDGSETRSAGSAVRSASSPSRSHVSHCSSDQSSGSSGRSGTGTEPRVPAVRRSRYSPQAPAYHRSMDIEEAEENAEAARSNLKLLGYRNFGPYFFGNLLSQCGPWFQNIDQALGIPAAFAINSLSYLALIGGLLLVQPREQALRHRRRPRLRDSIALVRQDLRLAGLLTIIVGVTLAADPVNTLTPAFATQIFHHSDSLTGYLVAAFGLGAAVAGFTVGGRADGAERRMAVTAAVTGVGMVA